MLTLCNAAQSDLELIAVLSQPPSAGNMPALHIEFLPYIFLNLFVDTYSFVVCVLEFSETE